ncbi:plasmid pRiA4b ORF-3 family protein [Kribbella sp. NPDC055071]
MEQFTASISGVGSDQLRQLLPQLLEAVPDSFDQAVPSRRRPRRDDVVTYQVRVDLAETKPPLWRRLELSSDLTLNDVHDIIQIAFGWTDSHLHEFAVGRDYYHPASEHYLCPFQVEEGEIGVPEEDVRLDEVLAKRGDELHYLYDFGDGWMHVIKLESEKPRDESSSRAVCIGGRRPGPSEDCGGVYGYELICAALDPHHPDRAETVADYARMYGEDADPGTYGPTPFDPEAINKMLSGPVARESDPAGPLEDLIDAIGPGKHRQLFQRLVADADLDQAVDIDADTAARMVAPYSWLLDRVGADGIKLTGAGYLPPVHVEAAVTELGLAEEWIGKGNREVQTRPVLRLRETAQILGLVRKHKGALVLTPRGRALRADPLALWWHLAEHMPPTTKYAYETHAGLICLVALAAGSTENLNLKLANLLAAIGWGDQDGTPVTPGMANDAAWDCMSVLRRLGAVIREPRDHRFDVPTPEGVMFARAALRASRP